ncbi:MULTISPECIES: MCE family protein [unclassified Rhodococcus (in: high G+C Gram-positive bacteria)]|uniref:MCE family protein n=1 Tax=unclassified Rhodococcus (in: high G+C Gram-positive bacteria) TaxID=192944 RepID=UPI0007BC4FD6|nr:MULTISPECIES: MCE family protein [unclassified Rhodococcus (in: high G+C Gram-positive bacteria)]KZE99133.1 mammalian cell entry protein [Rhodococcus sp. EPR-279]KZE99195.1 mammalian cell entry protein [Rhodococcus sp. EPR-147]
MTGSPSPVQNRLLGIGLVVLIVMFVGWSVTSYNKTFKDVVTVSLETDSVGNALPRNADVKVRGMIVGEVRSATTSGGVVTSELAIEPDMAEMIPSNATARLLPKTLFGERYVALELPDGRPGSPITEGTVLKQDRSGNAIEVGQVLDGLLPLLQAVPPEDLSNTLGALAQGLSGRGEELGLTIDRLENIFAGLNTELPAIQEDLRGLADFSQTYADAAPALINALDNLRTTGNTVVEKRPALETLYSSVTSASGTTADFLDANSADIIGLAANSREALEVFAEFSPAVGCTVAQFAEGARRGRIVTGVGDEYPGINVSMPFVNPKGRYLPNQDEPRLFEQNRPPSCPSPLDRSAGEYFPQYPGGSPNDGSYQVPSRNPGQQDLPSLPAPQLSPVPASYANSVTEQQTLAVVYGGATGIEPDAVPSWTTTVGAPALRGTQVTFR